MFHLARDECPIDIEPEHLFSFISQFCLYDSNLLSAENAKLVLET